MFYDRTDKTIDALDDITIKRFAGLKTRLNASPAELEKAISDLYDGMTQTGRELFTVLADAVYRDHYEGEKTPAEKTGEGIVEDVLTGYDPVSKYVFTHEMERRVSRLFEAVMGSPSPEAEVDAAMRSMALAYHIYAVRVTDEAAVRAMKASGVKQVQWIAEDDDHTCKVCHKRDNIVYKMEDVPPKPHINCRCWLVRVP